jgi:hypothetical protein
MSNYQSVVPVRLAISVLPTGALSAAVSVYTVPAQTRTIIKSINASNTTASPATFDIFLMPYGGVVGLGNALLYQMPVPAYTPYQWNGVAIMNQGDQVYVLASAGTTITVIISGAECS